MIHHLKIYCQTSALAKLRKFIQLKLEGSRLSDSEQLQVTLAVEEVCANLIIHSHNCNKEDHISVEIFPSENEIIIEIKDQGSAFNLLDYTSPDLKEVIEEKKKGGIGIILVKKIMDEIQFHSHNGINTCRLIKKISS